jgi:hypothetical protein
MRNNILILSIVIMLCAACGRSVEPQTVAGYILSAERDKQITLSIPDGTPTEQTFLLSDDTDFNEGIYFKGNIAEVTFMPTVDEEEFPKAISITTDDTYPRVVGRWRTDKDDKLQIDITLQPHGRIFQVSPDGILQFNTWQLTGTENEITLHGTLSLPPTKGDKAEGKDYSNERRTRHFSVRARLADDEEGNTEQHKVLIITNDKGRKSRLYPAWR